MPIQNTSRAAGFTTAFSPVVLVHAALHNTVMISLSFVRALCVVGRITLAKQNSSKDASTMLGKGVTPFGAASHATATSSKMIRNAAAACADDESMAVADQEFANAAVAPEVVDDHAATHLSYCSNHELSSAAAIGPKIQHFVATAMGKNKTAAA
ncbi:hypothetical protein ACH5RR_036659 [Cinchona calisaya]|uniref:Uncharacterized protein n=1 Tax=Cinchona calisaya TaxID=153742 RepID=A0ABD2Y8R9_9GENT